jgi:hypothetical protein
MRPGKACFVCEGSDDTRGDGGETSCPKCLPTVELLKSKAQRVLEHIGSHVLYDSTIDRSSEPCGLCLLPSPMCAFYLKKTKGRIHSLQLDHKKSRCQNIMKFSYAVASKSEGTSPCSNVPIKCPLCADEASAVWRYSIRHHLINCHPSASLSRYEALWKLSRFEEQEMRKKWNNRFKVAKRRQQRRKGKEVPLKHTAHGLHGCTCT